MKPRPVLSAVYDFHGGRIPDLSRVVGRQVPRPVWPKPSIDLAELTKRMELFEEAKELAAEVDKLMGFLACVDERKTKADLRLKKLKDILAKPPEFVVSTGAVLPPGTYRIVDGRLHRVVETVVPVQT